MLYRWVHYRRILFQSLNRIPFWIFAVLYCVYFAALVQSRVGEYENNISSLLGIYEGFAKLNPHYREESFLLYKEGGYDGQFFYFIARYLFLENFSSFPVLDSFRLRFTRIGMSLLGGFGSSIFGFEHYPLVTLLILVSVHLIASYLFKKILGNPQKGLYLVFLFSPFTINASLLLVSDGLFAACFFILVYAIRRAGLPLTKQIAHKTSPLLKKEILLPLFLGTLFFLSIRETSLPFLGTIFLYALFMRQFFISGVLFWALIIYLCFYIFVGTYSGFPEGTNPLGFIDLSDYPLFGFVKSLHIPSPLTLGNSSKEAIKIVIFGVLLSVGLQTLNARTLRDRILVLPLYFIALLGIIAEAGYWSSFDNSSRFFTLAVPYGILLSSRMPMYRYYGSIELSFFLLTAITVRYFFIKQVLSFVLW